MKNGRHQKIVELVTQRQIETQEELADLLNAEGFRVTQATVSRDIKALQLSKAPGRGGRQYYQILKKDSSEGEKYTRVLREGLLSMDIAGNLLVIKTMTGMANAVAAALDHLQLDKIVGTLAGDDTIMCALKDTSDAQEVLDRLSQLLGRQD